MTKPDRARALAGGELAPRDHRAGSTFGEPETLQGEHRAPVERVWATGSGTFFGVGVNAPADIGVDVLDDSALLSK